MAFCSKGDLIAVVVEHTITYQAFDRPTERRQAVRIAIIASATRDGEAETIRFAGETRAEQVARHTATLPTARYGPASRLTVDGSLLDVEACLEAAGRTEFAGWDEVRAFVKHRLYSQSRQRS